MGKKKVEVVCIKRQDISDDVYLDSGLESGRRKKGVRFVCQKGVDPGEDIYFVFGLRPRGHKWGDRWVGGRFVYPPSGIRAFPTPRQLREVDERLGLESAIARGIVGDESPTIVNSYMEDAQSFSRRLAPKIPISKIRGEQLKLF